jgi:hypothetical protein
MVDLPRGSQIIVEIAGLRLKPSKISHTSDDMRQFGYVVVQATGYFVLQRF